MMVMTAKVDFKKVILVLAAVAAVILGLILVFGGGTQETVAKSVSVATNDGRVKFLEDFGWQVTTTPVQSSQVRIPEEMTDVYRRYNALQQSQGYDLSDYAGKTVMRYVYAITNYPGASEPVYATLLVYNNRVIGGDITNTAVKGRIHGFAQPTQPTQPTQTAAQPG